MGLKVSRILVSLAVLGAGLVVSACGASSPALQAGISVVTMPASSPSPSATLTVPAAAATTGSTTGAPNTGGQAAALSVGTAAILARLISYDKAESPGPTEDYYWVNGAARITQSAMPGTGKAKFSYDSAGRSSIARATLTYALYAASKGSRQGSTLNPPGWPSSNPEVYSTSELTGKTSHTYLWNRSHSIADSLLGTLSYSSSANFTTGTKDQNVGADDNGGMRAAEEIAEDYWAGHPNSKVVIWYQTTPLYSGANMIPSGSIVDELSSDGFINKEIVVLNDEEGIAVNYASGGHSGGSSGGTAAPATTTKPTPKPTATTTKPASTGCTTTSTGSCIKRGEFCAAADHGDYGTDASGTRLLCEEDGTRWRWE